MSEYRKSLLIFLLLVIAFEIIFASAWQIKTQPGWNDEARFHKTIIRFSEKIDAEGLKHYEQMSPPLPFLIFGLWGRIFGTDLFTLRILNIILAVIVYLIFHRIMFLSTECKRTAEIGSAYLVLFPYMAGLSIFVYTEMTALIFMMLSILFLIRRRYVLLSISLALMLLARQYLVFFNIGIGCFFLMQWLSGSKKDALKGVASAAVSIIPYLLLVIYWGGLSPDNQLRPYYLSSGISYKFHFLNHYIILLFLFILPFYFFKIKDYYSNTRVLIFSVIISPLYFLFPIGYKEANMLGVNTVGLFDRALQNVVGNFQIIQVIYYSLYLFDLPVLILLLKETYKKIRHREHDMLLMLNLIIILFLVIMPFSYIGWEKYFVPLLPFLIIRILLTDKKGRKLTASDL